MTFRLQAVVFFAALFTWCASFEAAEKAPSTSYPWLTNSAPDTIENRYAPPDGFVRTPQKGKSFGLWLRQLPLLDGRPKVMLFNGQEKGNQTAHDAVLDIDVGERDLQQCADAVMRLRAEYLRSSGQAGKIVFRFTNGVPAKWTDWKNGSRPIVLGNKTEWKKTSRPAADYRTFRRYLTKVFQYAGTASLSREMTAVSTEKKIEAGDVFITGGFPGHAVIVVDTAENSAGEQVFLIAQSYMPAQQVHILKNPNEQAISPWYRYQPGPLFTPEWNFEQGALKRFACSPSRNDHF